MMRSFFQIVLSIVLGTFLGHGLYTKLMHKRGASTAQTVEVNPPFLAESIELNEQPAETHEPLVAEMKPEPVIKSAVPTETAVTTVAAAQTATKTIPAVEAQTKVIEMRKIEPVQTVKLQAETVLMETVIQHSAIEATIKQLPKSGVEAAGVNTQVTETQATTLAEEASVASAEPKAEKKKFLFFHKKNK